MPAQQACGTAGKLPQERAVFVVAETEEIDGDANRQQRLAARLAEPGETLVTLDGEERTLVDGGLVANFPVWIFDDARRRRCEREK